MALIILIAGLSLGTLVTLLNNSKNRIIHGMSSAFMWYVRGIPLLVHIYIIYYLLPQRVPAFLTLIIAYVFYSGATQSENVRTALSAVPKGQYEAAYCAGLTPFQTFRRIVFPQAMVVVLPILMNVFLNIVKGLSLAFMIGVVDIFARAKLCIAENEGYIEAYVAIGLVYWAISLLFNFLKGKLERNLYRKQGVVL